MNQATIDNLTYIYALNHGAEHLASIIQLAGDEPDYFINRYGSGVDLWKEKVEEMARQTGFVDIEIAGFRETVPLLCKPKDGSEPGYVYIITDGTAVKIGKTTDIEARMSEIQTSNPREIILLQEIECNNMTNVEASLHMFYRSFSLRGEWFDLLPHFGLDPNDCIHAAIGDNQVRHEYQYSVVIEGFNKVRSAKVWIRNPDKKKRTRTHQIAGGAND